MMKLTTSKHTTYEYKLETHVDSQTDKLDGSPSAAGAAAAAAVTAGTAAAGAEAEASARCIVSAH